MLFRSRFNLILTTLKPKKIVDNDHEFFRTCLGNILSILQILCDTGNLKESTFQWKLMINSSDVVNDCDGFFILENDSDSVSVTSIKHEVVTSYSVYSLNSTVKYFTTNINLPFVNTNEQILEYSNQIKLINKFKYLLTKIINLLLENHE